MFEILWQHFVGEAFYILYLECISTFTPLDDGITLFTAHDMVEFDQELLLAGNV